MPRRGNSRRSIPQTDQSREARGRSAAAPRFVSAAAAIAPTTAAAAPLSAPSTPPWRDSLSTSTGAAVHARQCARPSTAASLPARDFRAVAASATASRDVFASSPEVSSRLASGAARIAGAYSRSTSVSWPGTTPSGTLTEVPGSHPGGSGILRMTAARSPATPVPSPSLSSRRQWIIVRGCLALCLASPYRSPSPLCQNAYSSSSAAGSKPRRWRAGTNCCLPWFSFRWRDTTSELAAAPSLAAESRYRSPESESAGCPSGSMSARHHAACDANTSARRNRRP
mmetsp:Transcript_6783/g.27690  ORF Transcript_6783/g.27690 Transcript_6783/m.27690 type:complete len:284 (+) Transcript_6783:1825-2676(+)